MDFTLDGRNCFIEEAGEQGPVIVWGMFPFSDQEPAHTAGCIREAAQGKPYVLAAFTVQDWNAEFSPWEAPQAFSDVPLAGGGGETLRWLADVYIPYLKKRYGENRPVWLMGYSLAGLFSLWAAYETALFDGVVCCSGSLWYQGWDDYVKTHSVRKECMIYLSLGGKEEKTKNELMAKVGDRTRAQEKILKNDPMVKAVTLAWNSGGHFADSGIRLGKGVQWLLTKK